MTVRTLRIKGFRGFSEEQSLRFGQPNGDPGGGLTILVGPNNGGKSTVIESVQAVSAPNTTFSEGKCNQSAGDRVSICIEGSDYTYTLSTIEAGGSQTAREPSNLAANFYVLPSRRFFNPYFGYAQENRIAYLSNTGLSDTRSHASDRFSFRLFNALEYRAEFNKVLERVVSPAPIWTIDQSDQGQYYVKPQCHGQSHNSDSLGEGIVSLLFIVDALYDSQPGDFIAIDEPELSLHPAYQRRLATLLANYALDRQILYATHSPYFVDFKNVINGAEVARVHKSDGGSVISQLNRNTAQRFQGVLNDTHNPHVLGLDAREAFFQEDGVVVVEGQEDVVYYPRTLNQLVDMGRMNCADADYVRDRFFGWGAGGADNIERIVELLSTTVAEMW